MKVIGYAAQSPTSAMAPFRFERRALRPEDVGIEILYCGICHSDLHQARNDWHNSRYPVVPGHEIVGRVTSVGAAVTKYKVGDMVAVGCLVDSCQACPQCDNGLEQYCTNGPTLTYNGRDRQDRTPTYGGYSNAIVVREEFVLRVPEGLDPARAAPLLCAGITSWSPLRHWKVGPNSKIAVAGLGGLGHMGVKLAAGMGADITVITTSPAKAADARALGAQDVLISTDETAMLQATGRFDFILDTIPVGHDVGKYLSLLKVDGALVLVGVIEPLPSFHSGLLLGGRKILSGSGIGGIAETQALLDFCAEKNILPDIEMTSMQAINQAFDRIEKADVKYRFVIDMATLAQDAA